SRLLISRVQARSEHHVRFGVLCPWPRRGVGISVKHDNLAGFSTCKGVLKQTSRVRNDEGEMLGHGFAGRVQYEHPDRRTARPRSDPDAKGPSVAWPSRVPACKPSSIRLTVRWIAAA